MADMHTLNTRIKLKYDTYENWVSKNPVLLAGEVAIATVAANDAEGKPGFQNLPNVVIKVGDGSSNYTALKFVSALAADVHSWAKESKKPVYTATEIENLETYINGIIDGTDKIQDTDTTYEIKTIDESTYKLGLYSWAKGEDHSTAGTLVSTIDLSAIDTRLDTVEAALGENGTVAQKIAAAIDALAMTEVAAGTTERIVSVKQEAGKVTVTKGEMGIANVAGLQAALDAKQDDLVFDGTYDASTNKVATVKTVSDAVTSGIGALDMDIVTAGEGEIIESVKQEDGKVTVTKRDLVAADIPTITQAQVDGLEDALDAKQDVLAIADGYNAESNKVATEATVTKAVADLNGAMHFEGVVNKDPSEFTGDENAKYSAGDVVLFGYDEYVYDGSVWHKLGNESIYKLKSEANEEHEAMTQALEDGLALKQDNLGFEGTYNKETNKVVTKSAMTTAITDAIGALDYTGGEFGDHKFVTKVTEEDGKVVAEYAQPAVADIAGLQDAIDGLQGDIDDLADNKQDNLTFNGTYDASNNPAATVKTVTDAIGALDNTDAAVAGQFVTEVKQEDGKVTVARADVTSDMIKQGTLPLVFDCGNATL